MLRKRANNQLTPAELRVVKAILAGHTTGQALCTVLCLAHGTIAAHLESIYKKTGAAGALGARADIVLMALGRKGCQIDLATATQEYSRRVQVLEASGS